MSEFGISNKASEKEKLKSEFADMINGLNCVGKISYATYCDLFDFTHKLLDDMYELGRKEHGDV